MALSPVPSPALLDAPVGSPMPADPVRRRFSLRLPWRKAKVVYFSTLTCPECKSRSRDQMPSNASVYFYECMRCYRIIKPLVGKCCVYCSYADVACPSMQRGK